MPIIDRLIENYDVKNLNSVFKDASPAPMIVLDDFFPEDTAKNLSKEIDSIDADLCRKFTRNGSYMEECNNLSLMPLAQDVIGQLHSQTFMKWLNQVTGIDHLIPDPYLIGAGYSRSFKGDSLKNHIDFNWNDTIKLYRALTLIIYLSEGWQEEWGGNLEFSSFDNQDSINKVYIKWNRAIIWQHHESCFHGYPEPIDCPADQSRKTLRLFYYVSNQEPLKDQPPHRSLYWYDLQNQKPVDDRSHE